MVPSNRQPSHLKPVLVSLILIGAALRLWQYAADTSLWLDEIALAENVLQRPLGELLTAPLAYFQVAPRGFLLAEKAAVALFGPSEYALRLFPLLCSLAALIAFRRVAERVHTGLAVPVAVLLFAAAMPFIFYAAQTKQYSADVLVAVLLLWLALDLDAGANLSQRRALGATLAGAVAPWFSHPAVFVLAGIGIPLAAQSRRLDARSRRRLYIVVSVWAVSALCAVGLELSTASPQTREYMQRFWAPAMLPSDALHMLWPLLRLRDLLGQRGLAALGYPASILYLSLAVFGLALLFRRRRGVALFLILPILLTAAASAVRQYPFADRLILFLVPGFLLAIAEAIEWTRLRAAEFSRVAAAAMLVALAGPALYALAAKPPVYRLQDLKPVLAYLQEHRRPGDAVYVHYRGAPSIIFYGARYGLRPSDYTIGGCYLEDTRRYLEEIDRFRGSPRLWVVAADVSPVRTEPQETVRYLDAIGLREDSFVVPARTPTGYAITPAAIYLYDLSDPQRLARADASSFPMTRNTSLPSWMRCAEGPISADAAHR
ncbi:MAG TPA: hypothetical protein VGH16_18245 [Candidatus Binatia bacterium]